MTAPRVLLACGLAFTVLAYARVNSASFVYEDENAAQSNPAVNGKEPIQLGRARWLSALSHRLVFRAFGPSARASHLTNLALHLTNGVLVFAIASELLTPSAGVIAAWIFMLHPLQTESVAYISSRSELLATGFALCALWLGLRASRWWHYVGVWSCVALAVCAKESSAVIVPLYALTRLYQGRRFSGWLLAGLLLPVWAMAWSVVRFDYQARSVLAFWPYMATQTAAFWRYAAMIPVPFGQSIDHDYEVVAWSWRWLALGATIALVNLALFATLSIGDEHHAESRVWDYTRWIKPAAFGIAWCLIALGPRFVMRIPEMLNEHQMYLPVVGVSFALAFPISESLQLLWLDTGRWLAARSA